MRTTTLQLVKGLSIADGVVCNDTEQAQITAMCNWLKVATDPIVTDLHGFEHKILRVCQLTGDLEVALDYRVSSLSKTTYVPVYEGITHKGVSILDMNEPRFIHPNAWFIRHLAPSTLTEATQGISRGCFVDPIQMGGKPAIKSSIGMGDVPYKTVELGDAPCKTTAMSGVLFDVRALQGLRAIANDMAGIHNQAVAKQSPEKTGDFIDALAEAFLSTIADVISADKYAELNEALVASVTKVPNLAKPLGDQTNSIVAKNRTTPSDGTPADALASIKKKTTASASGRGVTDAGAITVKYKLKPIEGTMHDLANRTYLLRSYIEHGLYLHDLTTAGLQDILGGSVFGKQAELLHATPHKAISLVDGYINITSTKPASLPPADVEIHEVQVVDYRGKTRHFLIWS